jgi:hypothetical protein
MVDKKLIVQFLYVKINLTTLIRVIIVLIVITVEL